MDISFPSIFSVRKGDFSALPEGRPETIGKQVFSDRVTSAIGHTGRNDGFPVPIGIRTQISTVQFGLVRP